MQQGHFRSTQPDASKIFCATKVCYFASAEVTKESIEANVTERLTNISAQTVELLQLHWQNVSIWRNSELVVDDTHSPQQYADKQYVKAVQLIQDDPRVQSIGLVNFDTTRMEEILDSGVKIVSNQVQFSLVDLRPTFLMGDSCRKHDVKLLTYGSLVSIYRTYPVVYCGPSDMTNTQKVRRFPSGQVASQASS